MGIRALARKYKVGRDTVRHALANPEPPRRKTPVRESPKLGPLKPAIDAMLRTDLDAPRKQRHTATRICNRLADEHGVEDVSYSSVRDYVRVRRAEIIAESGKQAQEAFVPQEHPPGAEAEVDFGEVHVILAGVRTRCYMFVFRMSMSGKAVHRVYATQSQEAFLEGHIEAFDVIGGIPVRHIRYDNLKSAVTSVVFGRGRGRVENDRWVLFRSFYGFDPFYCQPGVKGAHEKGGVEGEIGRFRRTWLTPMPEVDSLSELNDYIRRCEAREDHRRVTGRLHAVGQDFQTEREHLAALPAERFDPGLVLHPRVDRSALITARSAKYSVPARLIGRKVRVSLRASELVVFDGRTIAARHERVTTRNGQSINLDHYLEGVALQTRRVARLHRACSGPRRRHFHRSARGVLAAGPPRRRRCWRDSLANRRAAAAPQHARYRCDRRDPRRPVGRCRFSGCGRGRSTPACRRWWSRIRPSRR
ncbi:hypothetical protein MKCMC460_16520 [Mycobacterium sp. 20KCMC460]|nr:hypothetical protein MKCMC460_16520 [Mycobacterium sp. 20KCMC460]